MVQESQINWNKDWASKVSKEVFIENHAHLKDKFDLAAIWEGFQDKKEPVKPAEKEKK